MNDIGDADEWLRSFEQRIAGAESIGELVTAVCDEVRERVGYENAWLAVFEPEMKIARILDVQGAKAEDAWAIAPAMPIDTDPYISRLVESGETQVVEDAQTDPEVNRGIVEQLGNRTLVNVPMVLLDKRIGAIGTGTFGDEGVRLPSPADLQYLERIAALVVPVLSRMLGERVGTWLL